MRLHLNNKGTVQEIASQQLRQSTLDCISTIKAEYTRLHLNKQGRVHEIASQQ